MYRHTECSYTLSKQMYSHFLFLGISGNFLRRLCCCWLFRPGMVILCEDGWMPPTPVLLELPLPFDDCIPTKPPMASWWFSGWWWWELKESFVSNEPSEDKDTTLSPSSSSTCLLCLLLQLSTLSSWSEVSLFEDGESSMSSLGIRL